MHHTRPDGTPYPLEECPIDRAFPRNMREQGEEVFVHGDGHFYPVSFTASPILEDGRPVGTIIEARDVSEERRVERRPAFLADLGQALQPVTDPAEAVATAARMLGEHLGVDRCAYAEVEADQDHVVLTGDYTRGNTPSIVGRYAMSAFGAEALRLMREDVPYVVDDVLADPRVSPADRAAYEQTQIRAVISMPLHKTGRFVAGMAVHQRTPRHWLPDHVELVRTVARRCWESIDRTRARRGLQQSEHRLRGALQEAERARERAERLQALTAALAGARTLDDVGPWWWPTWWWRWVLAPGRWRRARRRATRWCCCAPSAFPSRWRPACSGRRWTFAARSRNAFARSGPSGSKRAKGPEGLDARLPPIAPVWDRLGVGSAAFVPLIAAGEPVGVISFALEGARTFAPEERAFLLALGSRPRWPWSAPGSSRQSVRREPRRSAPTGPRVSSWP